MTTRTDSIRYRDALAKLEAYCASRDYAGYCKFDGLLSPVLWPFVRWSFVTRLLAIQLVNRVPGLRPLLLLPKRRNPKGVANFIRAYARMPGSERKVRELADWLLANDSRAHGRYDGPGRAWGYHFPWQSPAFFQPAFAPNCIVSVFAAESMLEAYRVTKDAKYLEAACETRRYLLEFLPVLESDAERLCIGYVRGDLSWKVVNINAVAAGFLAKLADAAGKPEWREPARRMVRWVEDARDPENRLWNYTEPASQSGIGPDNYHTGGVLDGIYDVGADAVYWSALAEFRSGFFTPEMAPKWRLDRETPFDVHGAAQAILTFVAASREKPEYLEAARGAADWAIANLQDPESGRFYYQRFRFWTWKVDLMRWSNSWMMRALAELVERIEGGAP